ncbi:hypothetical protein C9J12_28010 [Photobacterium frigidiphilum]|uniref:Uncharacterized protein n=1 Tax=Photobacterium frigidiphilum TaxID=264736 RepID=A0A2T3J6J3_9GAMM|nr:hypothetical protein [Photobacterium frigidiphilum]PSU43627.1 hypothetical protein C9J12_28010 [Photobacterium frigidiphilum]
MSFKNIVLIVLVFFMIEGCKSSKDDNKGGDKETTISQDSGQSDPVSDLVNSFSKPFEIKNEKLNHAKYVTSASNLLLDAIVLKCINQNKSQCIIGEHQSQNQNLIDFKITSKTKFDIKIKDDNLTVTTLSFGRENNITLSKNEIPLISFGLLNLEIKNYKSSNPSLEIHNAWIIDSNPKSKEIGKSYVIKTLEQLVTSNDIYNDNLVRFSSGKFKVKYKEGKYYSWSVDENNSVNIDK